MRNGIAVVCLCAVAVMVGAHPLDNNHERIARQANTNEVTSSNPLSREKRTIGILRDLFPNFSRIIDNKIQQLTRIIFRIVGRLVLNGGGGGGGGGGNSDDDERRISITLPTYPPDELEDEDEDEESTDSASEATSDSESTASTTTTTASPSGDENDVAESKKNEVRIKREAPAAPAVAPAADAAGANASEEGETVEEEDLDSEATGDNEVAGAGDAESSEVEEEEEEEANPEDPRNKRFLNFNLGATASENGGGGSAGGSGNFLFDIIRRSADRAARMAGTVYRVLAGTDDAGLPTYDATENAARSLVAGSGSGSGSSGSGDAAGGAAPEEGKNNDEAAYGVGVPGPLTRLFVVANRGVASLIQDLILRLAQTSERIVNFKARLITSII